MAEQLTEEQEKKLALEEAEKIREEEYAAVFDEDSALDHVTAPVAEKKVEEEKEIPEEIEQKQTPSEDLSPTLQAKFDELQKALDDRETRLKQSESRIGSLQNKYHQAVKLADTLKNAPTKEEIKEALESQAKWAEMMEDYPSMTLVDERISKNEQKLNDEITGLRSQLSGFDQRYQSKLAQDSETQMKKDVMTLKSFYPNYYKDATSDEFAAWRGDQPPHIQLQANSNNLIDAAKTMHRFLKDTKGAEEAKPKDTVQNKNKERLAMLAETEKESGTTPVISKTDEELSEQELRDKIFEEEFSKD